MLKYCDQAGSRPYLRLLPRAGHEHLAAHDPRPATRTPICRTWHHSRRCATALARWMRCRLVADWRFARHLDVCRRDVVASQDGLAERLLLSTTRTTTQAHRDATGLHLRSGCWSPLPVLTRGIPATENEGQRHPTSTVPQRGLVMFLKPLSSGLPSLRITWNNYH